jgi:predicted secreted protein
MAKVNGTSFTVIDGSDSLLHSTNCTLNLEQDLPDSTNKGSSGWAEHINGLRNWSIDFEGMYDTTGSGLTPDEIVGKIIARTADATVQFTPDAGTSGWEGTGTFANISIDTPVEGTTSFSGSIIGNGALAAI